jgi:hypothetical protein
MKNYIRFWQYLAEFFLKQKMSRAKVAETIKTHISFQQIPPSPQKYRAVYENVKKKKRTR